MNYQRAGRDVAKSLARVVAEPLANRFWPKVEEIAARHSAQASERADERLAEFRAEYTERVEGMARDVDRAHGRIDEVAGWHTDLGVEFNNLRDRVGKLEHEISRIGAQLAALDTRVAGVERTVALPAGTEQTAQEAADAALLTEIRAEHQRVRARLTAVASYEERIGRLEESLPGATA